MIDMNKKRLTDAKLKKENLLKMKEQQKKMAQEPS